MKYLRIGVSLICVLFLALFGVFYFKEQQKDTTYPVISIDSEIIDISLKMTEEELLAGVTAYDEKDGDITSKLIVESISKFIEDGVSVVTYSVCDEDNHATSVTRKIRFVDYTDPTFIIKQSLVFGLGEKINLASHIGAYDCIDGDISDRVVITATDYNTNEEGVFNVSLRVTNSMGDSIYMELPVYIEDKSYSAPQIELTDYIVYAKKGEKIDLTEFILSAIDKENQAGMKVLIDTNYKPDVPGIYEAHYETTDVDGIKGHAVLTIIVEE